MGKLIKKISFGGITNSSSIDILVPHAIFNYLGAFLRNGFAHVDNVTPMIKTITWLLLSRLQGNKPHRNSPKPSEPHYTHQNSPKPSGTSLRNLHQHTPEPSRRSFYSGTLWNLPEPASGTYTSIRRNCPEPSGTYLRNLHQHTTFRNPPPEPTQHTPELSGTFQNLPPEPTPAYAGTLRNLPDRNLHQHTPELSGTFRNLPPEPAPATRTDTHRSLSGLKTPLAYAVGEKLNPSTKLGETADHCLTGETAGWKT